MILNKIAILRQHGVQYIQDLDRVELPERFRGRPVLSIQDLDLVRFEQTMSLCPTGALCGDPLSLDMGRCIFCGECAVRHPENIRFTNDFRMAARRREDLVVYTQEYVAWEHEPLPPKSIFRNALKLREVSAGGDASCEMELNASGNVNFDFARYGVEFTASPRHSDGVVITGPISANMARECEATLAAIPEPRVMIVVGVDAISGGLFAESEALDRSIFERHTPDLYVPGNPAHPLTFIDGVLQLIGKK